MPIVKKRGQLSNIERATITEMVNAGKSTDIIAVQLGRTVEPINRYIKTLGISKEQTDEAERLIDILHNRSYWPDTCQQFSRDELRYFETAWADLFTQFREDVLFSEELQLKQLITIDILLSRSMKERKLQIDEIEKIQKKLDIEYKVDESVRDTALIVSLETNLSFIKNSISAYTAEYTKLLDKQQGLQKDMKSTRDQRIKKVEDSKSSWAGYLRAMEEETIRAKQGEQASLLRMAKDAAKTQLYDYHQFDGDGKLDRPILNAESTALDIEGDTDE